MKNLYYDFLSLEMSELEFAMLDLYALTDQYAVKEVENRINQFGKAPADVCLTRKYRITVTPDEIFHPNEDGTVETREEGNYHVEEYKVTINTTTFTEMHPEYRVDHGYLYRYEQ